MSDWQERITHETAPAVRVEHELRYRIAAPLIATSAVWVELGCGNGVAATAALAGERPGRAVLVDIDADAVERAQRSLALEHAAALTANLSDPADLRRIGEHLLASEGERVVTCFEVVEHLETFVPLLEWCGGLARDGAATCVLSVPNDAFWSIQNPHHRSAWGEGAFAELRRLLPAERTLLRQVALAGSAVLDCEERASRRDAEVGVGGEGTVSTHFIAAFGPRHSDLWRGALVVQSDQLAQRRWERQRESNLAVAEAKVAEDSAEFAEWRAYIHQLERELGRPLAGSPEAPPPTGNSAGGGG